jgi:tetratricopeptide (TPR) repeat protein
LVESSQLYRRALADFQRARGEPLALARAAARAAQPGSPELGDARLLEASLLLCSRDARDFEAAGWAYAELASLRKNPWQEQHAAAIRIAVDGDYAGAVRAYDQILERHPADDLAIGVAHVFDYLLGNSAALRARATRALASRDPSAPGYHALLSLYAFALQENGDYNAAEEVARRALEREPLDVRAHHAVAHVMEMQGRFEDGVRWMGGRSSYWTGAGAASVHLWWHLALYHLELGQPQNALAVLDHRMQGEGLSELIDASALLWRLHLHGVATGGRFDDLAARWAPHAGDAHCAFNDLHAMMAFVAASRWDCAERLLAAQSRRIERAGGANHDMTRLVGYPASRALAAFGRGDYAAAEALLRGLPPVAHRIGGSHAQRDVLQLTRAVAGARRHRARNRPLAPRFGARAAA